MHARTMQWLLAPVYGIILTLIGFTAGWGSPRFVVVAVVGAMVVGVAYAAFSVNKRQAT